jgi:hypothetical protein
MDGQFLLSMFKRLGFEIALYYGKVTSDEALQAIQHKISDKKQYLKDFEPKILQ